MRIFSKSREFLIENLKMSEYVTFVASRLTVAFILAIIGLISFLVTRLVALLGIDTFNEWLIVVGAVFGVFVVWLIVRFSIRLYLNRLSKRIPPDSDPDSDAFPSLGSDLSEVASNLNESGSVLYAGKTGEPCLIEGIYFEWANPENTILLREGEVFPPSINTFGFFKDTIWLLREYPYSHPSQEDSDLEND